MARALVKKIQDNNRIIEKILSSDQSGNGDIAQFQFDNLVIGRWYELSGAADFFDTNATNTRVELSFYSGPNKTGTDYGKSVFFNTDDNTNGTNNVSIKFLAQSNTLYTYHNGPNTSRIRGNGTKSQTFLQLEERNDLEEVANFT